MFGMVIAAGFAIFFYKIAEHDYGTGIWACIASIIVSALACSFIPLPFPMVIANVLLYLVLLAYNILRKDPPGTHKGL